MKRRVTVNLWLLILTLLTLWVCGVVTGLTAGQAHADPTDCGLGTYYDPATNTCLAIPNPAAPTDYSNNGYNGGNYSSFCFSGFLFSYCTGNY